MQALKIFTGILLCGVLMMSGGCQLFWPDASPGAKTNAPGAKTSSPKTTAPVKMTISQTMGLDVLKAMNANPKMNGHQVSVGTTPTTVILNGKVKSAAQKKLAETIARQKAKKAKVINQITVSAK